MNNVNKLNAEIEISLPKLIESKLLVQANSGGESITPLQALEMFGCFRLGARINNLRDGSYDGTKQEILTIKEKNTDGNGYLHRNPVERGLVKEPGVWKWSSFRHYALREIGIVEIESAGTATDRETKTEGSPARVFLNPG